MSSGSSSSSRQLPGWLAAVGLVIATIALFISAQFFGILLLVIGLRVSGFSSSGVSDVLDDSIALQFLAVFMVELLLVGLLYLAFRSSKLDFGRSLKLNRMPSGMQILKVFAAYGLYLLSFITLASLLPVVAPSIDVEQSQVLGFSDPSGAELLLVFASLVILPAIAEEILFRGFLYQGLKRFINLKVAVAVTSIIFGVAHMEFLSGSSLNYIAAIDTAVFSVFLIALFEHTKNLWTAVGLHAVKNTVAFSVLFLI